MPEPRRRGRACQRARAFQLISVKSKRPFLKFIEAAPKSTIVFMVESICKRFRLEAPCKALLDALAAQDELTK